MESVIKFLVILVVIAGFIWLFSPIVDELLTGVKTPPSFQIPSQQYSITPLEDTECIKDMCTFTVNGDLYNYGGPAKNIVMAMFFFDSSGKNIGSVNMPWIAELGEKKSTPFNFEYNYTCRAVNATVAIVHYQRG